MAPSVVVLIIIAAIAACIVGTAIYGGLKWRAKIAALRARLKAGRVPIMPNTYDQAVTDGLPVPVRKYFRAVLQDGQPMIYSAWISQHGQFRLGEAEGSWRPFSATQLVTTHPPGFDWNARVRMAAGVNVLVQDAYAAGNGILHAALLGLFTVAHLRDTPQMAEGELVRYLAEGPWYPTALLPGSGLRWEAIDNSSARAILASDGITVSVEFHFDEAGLIQSVRSACRYRDVGGALQPTPWEGKFDEYIECEGMRIPSRGEVAWQLPDGPFPYWRARITDIAFEFAQ